MTDNFDDFFKLSREDYAHLTHINKEEWQNLHPTVLPCASDAYYTNLTNRLIDRICALSIPNAPLSFEHTLALSVTMYLEDLVNEFGVWHAIRTSYRKTYGTWLPFYDTEHSDYLLDNVNIEDLKFITWQSFCRCGQHKEVIYSPYSNGVEYLSKMLFDEIVDEYENAPNSTRISKYINASLRSDDYFVARQLALWLSTKNYLTAIPNIDDLIEREIIEIESQTDDISQATYMVAMMHAWSRNIGPMGMASWEILAEICRNKGYDKAAERFDNVRARLPEEYKLVEFDKNTIKLKNYIDEYIIDRHSINECKDFTDKTSCFSQLIFFGNYWHTNGMSIFFDKPATDVDDKVIIQDYHPLLKEKVNKAIDDNNGELVLYFKNYAAFKKFTDKYFGEGFSFPNEASTTGYIMLLSRTEPPHIFDDMAPVFKIKGNCNFSKDYSEHNGLEIITSRIADDVAKYIQDNKLAPEIQIYASQGKDLGRAIVQDNLRFLCSFYRTPCGITKDLINKASKRRQ